MLAGLRGGTRGVRLCPDFGQSRPDQEIEIEELGRLRSFVSIGLMMLVLPNLAGLDPIETTYPLAVSFAVLRAGSLLT